MASPRSLAIFHLADTYQSHRRVSLAYQRCFVRLGHRLVAERLARHEFARPFEERNKDLTRLILERNAPAIAGELSRERIQLEPAKPHRRRPTIRVHRRGTAGLSVVITT